MTAEELLDLPVAFDLCDSLVRLSEAEVQQLDEVSLYKAVASAAMSVRGCDRTYLFSRAFFPRERIEGVAEAIAHRFDEPWASAPATTLQANSVRRGAKRPMSKRFPVINWRLGKPLGGIWTASVLKDGTSAWQPALDAKIVGDPWEFETQHFEIDATGLDIFELNSPADWMSLCETYPLVRDDEFAMDWTRVAQDYQGVHVTPLGLLTTQGVVIEQSGRRTWMEQWDSESTVWLQPISPILHLLDTDDASLAL